MDISNIEAKDMQEVLKGLKEYNKMKKELGNRGARLFETKRFGKNNFKVEYSGVLDLENIKKESKKVFADQFGVEVDEADIEFVKNADMIGGARFFVNDKLLDLSADSIFKKIQY